MDSDAHKASYRLSYNSQYSTYNQSSYLHVHQSDDTKYNNYCIHDY